MLSKDQIEQFKRDGYLVINDFLSLKQTEQLYDRANTIIEQIGYLYDDRKDDITIDTLKTVTNLPKTKFNTENDKQVGDRYFLDSADKLCWFFEESALDENGKFLVPFKRSINKIGHGLHLHDDLFCQVTLSTRVQDICRELQYQDPRVLQTMLIFKHPMTGGVVNVHQDSTFLYTQPQESTLGFWFALEDVTLQNGCLWFVPGSHKTHSNVSKRFVRNPEFFVDDDLKQYKDFQTGVNAMKFKYDQDYADYSLESDQKWVPVEIKKGSLVLIHGAVLHKSERNNSDTLSRYAYAFHVVEGSLEWPKENWIQSSRGFTKLFK